jgi:glycosyltransferase involved in cell wall biosynthesis
MVVDVIIPAYNEEQSIALVVDAIPKDIVRHIYVSNNASRDNTANVAASSGAIVVDQPIPGYGNACLKAMQAIANNPIKPDVVVFLDGDNSDFPEDMHLLLREIKNGHDLVIGSRALGERQSGSMTPQQLFGNWLATRLIRLFFGYSFTDLGPFRAVRYDALMAIDMKDKTYGWTVEMQVKAAKLKLRCTEVPMRYRKRIGVSKVSGTIKGTIMAGYKILWTIFKSIWT